MKAILALSALLIWALPVSVQEVTQASQPTRRYHAESQDNANMRQDNQEDLRILSGLVGLANKLEARQTQQDYEDAALLYQAVLSILGKKYGPENPRMHAVSDKCKQLAEMAGKTSDLEEMQKCTATDR
jgi:hypothetical protein